MKKRSSAIIALPIVVLATSLFLWRNYGYQHAHLQYLKTLQDELQAIATAVQAYQTNHGCLPGTLANGYKNMFKDSPKIKSYLFDTDQAFEIKLQSYFKNNYL